MQYLIASSWHVDQDVYLNDLLLLLFKDLQMDPRTNPKGSQQAQCVLVSFSIARCNTWHPPLHIKKTGWIYSCFKGTQSVIGWLQGRSCIEKGHGEAQLLSSRQPEAEQGSNATDPTLTQKPCLHNSPRYTNRCT